jgi:ribosomal protein S18 acetylase RimI-like enzyme
VIRAIEELSLNAWPAAQTQFCDGWVLRFSGGYTRRANSVQPLYPSTFDLSEKIRTCEAAYRANGQAVIFKMTPANQPTDLDDRLAALGYARDADTSVQTLDLYDAPEPPFADLDVDGQCDGEMTDEWMAAFARMSATSEPAVMQHRRILEAILPRCGYLSLRVDGQIAACGMGVVEHAWIGLFDIVVDAAQRNRGLGERVVRGLLGWGRQNGARSAYLQVMHNNPSALRLYARAGFCELYTYWCRVKA